MSEDADRVDWAWHGATVDGNRVRTVYCARGHPVEVHGPLVPPPGWICRACALGYVWPVDDLELARKPWE